MDKYYFYKVEKEQSYWQVRDFLRQVWRFTDDKTMNWNVARLDYNRWHMYRNCYELDLLDYIYICQCQSEIVAVFIADCQSGYHLQVHPDHYTSELFDSLLEFFNNEIVTSEKIVSAHIPSPAGDKIFEEALIKAGFEPSNWIEVRREKILAKIFPAPVLPFGFSIRAMGAEEEFPARSWASWRAFHPDEPDEKYEGWEWYRNITLCPLYRRDLDLICMAPDDSIAGFATVWLDDYNQTGYFDPVGIIPDHWRKGLGRALLSEGFIRLQNLGAKRAYIESYNAPAHALYESVGLKTVKSLRTWIRKY